MVIPCLDHLANFSKIINIGWGVSVSEPKFKSDGVKTKFRNEFPDAIESWIFLLIRGGDTPTPPPHNSIQRRWTLIAIDLNSVVDILM